jgi:hypothetical protein
MTAKPATPLAGSTAAAARPPARRRNLLPFASVALVLLALFNGLDAMAALTDSPVVTATHRYVFGDLHSAGWALLALAVAQGLAGVALLTGDTWARWFAGVVLGLNAFTQFAFLPTYPAWSLTVIAVDLAALYAVVTSPSPPPAGSLPDAAPGEQDAVVPDAFPSAGRQR